MDWLGYALLAMLLKSGQNFVEKSAQQKHGSFLTTFLMIAISTIIIAPFVLISNPLPTVNTTFWIGILGAILLYALAKPMRLFAIGKGDISEIIPLVSFSSVFSLIFGWIFLKEIPTGWGLIGVSLIAIGGYLINFENANKGLAKLTHPIRQVFTQRTQSILFISLILGPLITVFDKLAINNTFPRSPHYVVLTENLVLLPVLVIFLFARKVNFNNLSHRSTWRLPIILGIIFGIKSLLSFSAISLGNIGYVAAISQLSSLVAVIGGVYFLGEKKLGQRLSSAILMATGAFLIAYLG